MPAPTRRLGEILVADYHVLETDVEEAVAAQAQGLTIRIGQFLVRRGILSDRDLATALGQQLGVPVVLGLPRLSIPDEVLHLVPMDVADRKLVIPVAIVGSGPGRRLVLAMADPTDRTVVEALERAARLDVHRSVATEEDVRRAFKVFYLGERIHADPTELTDSFEMVRSRLRGGTLSSVGSGAARDVSLPSGELFRPRPIATGDPIPMPSASVSASWTRTSDRVSEEDLLDVHDRALGAAVFPQDPDGARSTVGA